MKTVLPTKRLDDLDLGSGEDLQLSTKVSLLPSSYSRKVVLSSARSSKGTGLSLVPSGEKKVALERLWVLTRVFPESSHLSVL